MDLQSSNTYPVLRVELYGPRPINQTVYGTKPDSCNRPLGMENYGIDDSEISDFGALPANISQFEGPQRARLNSGFCWSSKGSHDMKEYIEVDLGQIKSVTGIALQGNPLDHDIGRVTNFTVQYNVNGKWMDHLQNLNVDINTDTTINWFTHTLNTRYVRVHPRAWNNGICMRMELYGCGPTCDNQPVGIGHGQIRNSFMTASSTLSDTNKASNARLKNADSWCAAMDDNNPHLQIDLGVSHVLCAVATQGNNKADQMVKSYTIQTSQDGKVWIDYKENGINKIFQGNADSNSISKNYFSESLYGRFIRILPKTFVGAPCLRVEFYGVEQNTCEMSSSGIGVPHSTIPDQRFTAYSSLTLYKPEYARTKHDWSWQSHFKSNKEDYVQVDLGDPHLLCAIGLQPSGQSHRIDERTTYYQLFFSIDGHNWTSYQNGTEQHGNKKPENAHHPTNITKNIFNSVQVAKFVRIRPTGFHIWKAIRMELYGLKQAWKKPLGLESVDGKSNILDNQLSTSSALDKSHNTTNGRLYSGSSWCAESTDVNPNFQIDLGVAKQLSGIGIQGDRSKGTWVTYFNLQYGYLPSETNTIQNIQTQLLDDDEYKVHWFLSPIGARYVGVFPTKWERDACMRIELFGNDRAPPAKIISFNVDGTLTSKPGSFVTVNCVASGDNAVNIQWLLNGQDVTDKSSANLYANGNTTSSLRIDSSSVLESAIQCKPRVSANHLRCLISVTCQALRENGNGDRKSIEIDVPIGPKPTTAPVEQMKTTTNKAKLETEKIQSAANALSEAWTLVVFVTLGMLGNVATSITL